MTVELANFCCGCNLKHGTIAIGVVQSVLAFTFMLLTAAYAEHPHELLDMSDPSIVPDIHSMYRANIISTVAYFIRKLLGSRI